MVRWGHLITFDPPVPETRSGPPASGALLSLVVPVFNEEEVINLFVMTVDGHSPAILEALGPGGRIEMVFVDDGSRDRTAEIIANLAERRPDIVLVQLSRNFGKDIALTAGLAHATGDAVIPMDVDLQDPPDAIPAMIAAWRKGAKVVNARRKSRGVDSWLKRLTAAAFYRAYNRIASYPIQENVGDFRLLDRAVVNAINTIPERVRFMKGLLSWVGFSQATVEYDRRRRAAGRTKWAYWRLWNFALDGITGSTTLPLRVWTYVGLILASGAVLYAGYIITLALTEGNPVPGYSSLLVVMLVIGAINMISLGLLGEYVGRIAIEVRQRPLYLVENIVGRRKRVRSAPEAALDSAEETPAARSSDRGRVA
ncbi:MAG: glycosyltransferase family 2 protein [Hyphomonadaceae bacterium]|nr:glycosyltransferase family 2 protein [Hyphomonadaceae bacterium]